MSSTKFVVVQLKELIKTAVFVLLGILLIALLVYLFIPKTKTDSATLYTPGTYKSAIMLHDTPVDIQVTVTDKEITKVELVNLGETQEVFFPLVRPTMESLADEIIETQSTDVAVSADSPITSQIILSAVENAVSQARLALN